MGYRHGLKTVFEIHLPIVWATKVRKPILSGEVGMGGRELIYQVCRGEGVEVLQGHVSKNQVHLIFWCRGRDSNSHRVAPTRF